MSIDIENRMKIISKFGYGIHDTGSSEVQIAFLTNRIIHLQGHFNKHRKDYHGKRGLLRIISKRRKLLNYLKSINRERYGDLIKKLGLRR